MRLSVDASENIYNQWRILKTDKQVARKILKNPGVTIELKRASNFEVISRNEQKYNYKIEISGLKSVYILRNCYNFLQNIITFYFSPKKLEKNTPTYNLGRSIFLTHFWRF